MSEIIESDGDLSTEIEQQSFDSDEESKQLRLIIEMDNMLMQIQEQQKINLELDQQISTYTKKIDSIKSESARNTYTQTLNQTVEFDDSLLNDSHRQVLKSKQASADQAKSKLKEIQEKFETLKEEVAILEEQSYAARTNIELAQNRIDRSHHAQKKLKITIDFTKNRIRETQAQLTDSNTQLHIAETQLKKILGDDRLTTEQKTQKIALEKEINSLEERVNEMKMEVTSIEDQIEEEKSKALSVQLIVNSTTNEISNIIGWDAEKERLQSSISLLEQRLQEVNQQISQKDSAYAKRFDRYRNLQRLQTKWAGKSLPDAEPGNEEQIDKLLSKVVDPDKSDNEALRIQISIQSQCNNKLETKCNEMQRDLQTQIQAFNTKVLALKKAIDNARVQASVKEEEAVSRITELHLKIAQKKLEQ